jgi:AcrR family transcriptional regulator
MERDEASPSDSPMIFPSADQDLAPTARRLLEAARRLLERSGLRALTFEAIGREAGETSSLIRYHFGDKAGLLVALIDWVMHEELDQVRKLRSRASSEEDGVDVLLDICRGLVQDTTSSVAFFELLPQLLRDARAHARLADLYSEYRRVAGMPLMPEPGTPSADASTLAALSIAVTDGLMIQQLIEPGAVDMGRAFVLWEAFIQSVSEQGHDAAPADGSLQARSSGSNRP